MRFPSSPLVWLTAPAGVLLGLAVASAQVLPPGGDPPRAIRVYEGVSNRGQFDEALSDAISRAMRALPGADRMVRYRVRDISGEAGGITGRHVLRVSIEVPSERPGDGGRPPVDRPGLPGLPGLRPELRLTPERVRRDESVTLTLELQNPGEQPVNLLFSSGQKYDFEAWRGNRLVWRWSQGRVFTQALVRQTLDSGQTLTWEERWDLRNADGQRLPAGEYVIRAYPVLQGVPQRLTASQRLVIE